MIIQEISKKSEYLIEFVVNNKAYIVSTNELKRACKDVEMWQQCGGTYFTIKLLELIGKADEHNKERILQGFPEVMCAYLLWYWNLPFKKELFED
ncbi:MAG: hypothetical protein IKU37_08780 [Candidatus Gastranaerophilales bacterium]|nr:hypothetical protein [Candidatus Gastranaerophilales bacterium]